MFNGWVMYWDIWVDYMFFCLDGKMDKFSFCVIVFYDFEKN